MRSCCAVNHHDEQLLGEQCLCAADYRRGPGQRELNLSSTYTYDAVGNPINVDGPRTDVTDTTAFTYDTERRLIQDHRRQGQI